MTTRMDIVCPRAGSDGKTYYTKIGVAFATQSGGWSLTFEALPLQSLNDNGKLECRALLMPPRDRDAAPAPRQHRGGTDPNVRQRYGGGGAMPAADLDDDVPFATNSMHAREPGTSRRRLP